MAEDVKKRHKALTELVSTNSIKDQQTLVQLIKSKYDIETNQSIVSRDLRQLGINKKTINGQLQYDLSHIDASQEILRLAVLSIEYNDALIVIKTISGLAAFVGDYLDSQDQLPILGTIAGENAIFVTHAKQSNSKQLYHEIAQLLYSKSGQGEHDE